MKFAVVFVALGLAALVGLWASRRLSGRSHGEPGVEGNARLTGYTAVALLVPLGVAIITGIRPGLEAHALVGFLLVPPVVLKLGSVGYRFALYYGGDPRYGAAGPPALGMRVLGPLVVVLTVALFATGIELWLFGFRYGEWWLTWHQATFLLWSFAMLIHVFAYVRRAPELVLADSREPLEGILARRSLVVGAVLFGVALSLAMLSFDSPFTLLPGSG
jgi:hypothetical protein